MDLGSVFGGQNDKNSIQNCVQKYVLFQHRFLNVFFSDFNEFGFILGASRASKNYQKSKKIVFGPRLERIWDFKAILEAILKRFFEILDGF